MKKRKATCLRCGHSIPLSNNKKNEMYYYNSKEDYYLCESCLGKYERG